MYKPASGQHCLKKKMLITVWWLRNRKKKKDKNLFPQFLLLLLDERLGDCLLPLLPGEKDITLTN